MCKKSSGSSEEITLGVKGLTSRRQGIFALHSLNGGFPLCEFFRAKRKACFDSFVLL